MREWVLSFMCASIVLSIATGLAAAGVFYPEYMAIPGISVLIIFVLCALTMAFRTLFD